MKKRVIYKVIACIMSFAMLTSSLPEFYTRAYTEEINNGIVWEYFSDTGLLQISGSGDMQDFASSDEAPWKNHSENVRRVEILDGVTAIANFAFSGMAKLETVDIAESVTRIGASAFANTEKLSDIYYAGSSIGWKAITKVEYWDDWTGSLTEKGSYTVHYGKILSYGVCGDNVGIYSQRKDTQN